MRRLLSIASLYYVIVKYYQLLFSEKMCYPFAAALVVVWDTFAMYSGHPKREVSIQFHNLQLYVQPLLLHQQALKLNVAINRGTGLFEVRNLVLILVLLSRDV